jgi:hypothetical protein
VCNADGTLRARLAVFKCLTCKHPQPQRPLDFVTHIRAWPATLSDVTTIVDTRMLRRYSALKLSNPQLSVGGFLKGVAAANSWPLKVL